MSRPKSSQTTKPIPIKLDAALVQRIDSIAKKIGEARSVVMRMAMRIGLDSLEKAFEASPADILKLVSQAATKNSSSSNSQGGESSGEKAKPAKAKRPEAA